GFQRRPPGTVAKATGQHWLPAAGGLSHLGALGPLLPANGAAATLLERSVHLLHAPEDLLRGLELLVPGRRLDDVEAQRLAELHGHLREVHAPPTAHAGRAVDRDRHDRRAGLQREPAHAGTRLTELAGPRTAALAVHPDAAAPGEDRVRGLEGLLVGVAAAHG